MPSFNEYFRPRSSPFAMKNSKPPLHEGMELSASELLDELTAPQVDSITATVATNKPEELTILIQVRKWTDTTNQTKDSDARIYESGSNEK
jgi:hypothetical protein